MPNEMSEIGQETYGKSVRIVRTRDTIVRMRTLGLQASLDPQGFDRSAQDGVSGLESRRGR
jgi:hypothetical protein